MNALAKRPGKIVLLADIQGEDGKKYENEVVRVVGYFQSYLSDSLICIEDKTNVLSVDCALLQPIRLTKGWLYHFIGEADWREESRQLILRAQVYRCLEGLDFQNYKKSLKYFQTGM